MTTDESLDVKAYRLPPSNRSTPACRCLSEYDGLKAASVLFQSKKSTLKSTESRGLQFLETVWARQLCDLPWCSEDDALQDSRMMSLFFCR